MFTLGAAGGMFTLGDSGRTVTLGDSGGIGTLRDGGGIIRTAGFRGMMLGSAGFVMALLKISARSTIACCWASPNWANRAAGAGLVRASVRDRAAMMAASMGDVFGTGIWCGNNCILLAVRSALVSGTYSRT